MDTAFFQVLNSSSFIQLIDFFKSSEIIDSFLLHKYQCIFNILILK